MHHAMNRRNRPATSRRRFPLSQVRLSRLREPDWELDNTRDDEASVASKTKPDNQRLGVTVFVRLTGNTPQKSANNTRLREEPRST
jgi:hypothetical protein